MQEKQAPPPWLFFTAFMPIWVLFHLATDLGFLLNVLISGALGAVASVAIRSTYRSQ